MPPRTLSLWRTLLVAPLVALMGCAAPSPILPTPTPLPPLESPAAAAPVVSPVATARPPASPTPLPLVVYGTGGAGLTLRRTPGLDGERLSVWPEGTVLVPLGEERQADGLSWKRVRDPDGTEGWAAATYLVDQATAAALPPPTPTPLPPPTRAATPTPAGPTPTLPPLRPTFTPAPEAAPTRAAAPPATAPSRALPTPTPRR